MEHQTISFEGYFGEELLSHELAHQWFGNSITCASWSDIWLNEGFATYLSGIIIEKNDPAENWLAWKKDLINYICSEPGGSVYVQDTTSYQRIFDGRLSYSKGAMVLHMLRSELGDSIFFTSIKNYLNDPLLK